MGFNSAFKGLNKLKVKAVLFAFSELGREYPNRI